MARAGRMTRNLCLTLTQPLQTRVVPLLKPSLLLHRLATHSYSSSASTTSPLTTAIKQGNLNEARNAFESLVAQKVNVNRKIISKLLLLARKGKKPHDLAFMSRIVSLMESTPGLEPTLFDYHALMYAYGIQHRPDDAYAVLARMRTRGIEPNVYSYNTVIGCYKRAQQFKEAESIFNSMPVAPDVTTYNTMIHIFSQRGQSNTAVELYERMVRNNVPADKYTYSAILSLATDDHRELGKHVYDQLLNQPEAVDTATFNTMLQFKQKYLNDILDLYYALPTRFLHVKPDLVTFNMMMNACLKASNPAKASSIYRDMQSAGIQPDIITYGTMIAAEADGGDLQGALDLFDEMCSQSIKPTERILTSLANVAGSGHNNALALLEVASKVRHFWNHGIRLGVIANNALLHGLSKHGYSREAQQLYDNVFRQGECRADIATFTHLIVAYINDDKIDDGMDIYYQLCRKHREMASRDGSDATGRTMPALDVVFYTSIISALARRPPPPRLGDVPDKGTSTTVGYMIDGDRLGDPTPALQMALTLFNDMRQVRIRPNAHAYATVLHACGRNQDMFVLEQIHNLIKVDLYFDPDTAVYNALMDAYNRVGDGDTVLHIWDTLFLSSAYDSATISVVLDSCGHNGRGDKAKRIWKMLQRNKAALNANNTSSYVECLCRTPGRDGWNEAKQLVTEALAPNRQPHCPPVDHKTVNTLISFARKKGFPPKELANLQAWKAGLCFV